MNCRFRHLWVQVLKSCRFAGATQNEIDEADAKALVAAGVKLVAEGANMPTTSEGIEVFHANKVEFAPAKAANAGGVAVSGLEMAQNSARLSWTREEVDGRLKVRFLKLVLLIASTRRWR